MNKTRSRLQREDTPQNFQEWANFEPNIRLVHIAFCFQNVDQLFHCRLRILHRRTINDFPPSTPHFSLTPHPVSAIPHPAFSTIPERVPSLSISWLTELRSKALWRVRTRNFSAFQNVCVFVQHIDRLASDSTFSLTKGDNFIRIFKSMRFR